MLPALLLVLAGDRIRTLQFNPGTSACMNHDACFALFLARKCPFPSALSLLFALFCLTAAALCLAAAVASVVVTIVCNLCICSHTAAIAGRSGRGGGCCGCGCGCGGCCCGTTVLLLLFSTPVLLFPDPRFGLNLCCKGRWRRHRCKCVLTLRDRHCSLRHSLFFIIILLLLPLLLLLSWLVGGDCFGGCSCANGGVWARSRFRTWLWRWSLLPCRALPAAARELLLQLTHHCCGWLKVHGRHCCDTRTRHFVFVPHAVIGTCFLGW